MTEVMKPKAPPVPKAPKATEDVPNVVRVKHKESGREFEVSKRYFENYRPVLEML